MVEKRFSAIDQRLSTNDLLAQSIILALIERRATVGIALLFSARMKVVIL
jgi:hypothetical protein